MKKQFLSLLILLLFIFSVSGQTKDAQKIDEFGFANCDDYVARMDVFWIELSNLPEAKGYVFVYEGKSDISTYDRNSNRRREKYVLPKVGEAKARIRTMKKRLEYNNYSPERVVFMEAGFRDKYTVEFWLVPKGAIPPKPTPTLKKIKHRKGKPGDFCAEF